MSGRITLQASMELLSDAIFGSGYSDAGGADILVCKDEKGLPFLRGSAWKGLLRESVENLLVWQGEDSGETLSALMGLSGWTGEADHRRITLTDLRLTNPPADPTACYTARTFTSIGDNGTVKAGSLRTAECVRRGRIFTGTIQCAREDRDLVSQALRGIRWVGTMRSRGFGEVRWTVTEGTGARTADGERTGGRTADGERTGKPTRQEPLTGHCLRYRLRLDTAALVTDLSRSQDNHYETRGYLPGAAVRGLVMGTLAAEQPDWFAEHRREVLSDSVRFLDALPVLDTREPSGQAAPPETYPTIPSVRGFFENKDESGFCSVLTADPEKLQSQGLKRAKTGAFCVLAPSGAEDKGGYVLRYGGAATGGTTRIAQSRDAGDGAAGPDGGADRMFQTRFLLPGQEFEGYILLDNPDLAEAVGRGLPETGYIGADRYAGFGQFTRTELQAEPAPRWVDAYGFRDGETPGSTLYLLALSPLALRGGSGVIHGFAKANGDENRAEGTGDLDGGNPLGQLAEKLGVGRLTVQHCATSLTEYGGYNRMWGCHLPAVRMYDRGSIFQLRCDCPPSLEAVRRVQAEGLGIRREEGFGQVLFLREAFFADGTGIGGKERAGDRDVRETAAAVIRRAKYNWVMDKAAELVSYAVSTSQIGTLQTLCEKAIGSGGDLAEIDKWFDLNIGKNARHSARFAQLRELTEKTLNTPLHETLHLTQGDNPGALAALADGDSAAERLRLLCMLFNYSRKSEAWDNASGGADRDRDSQSDKPQSDKPKSDKTQSDKSQSRKPQSGSPQNGKSHNGEEGGAV